MSALTFGDFLSPKMVKICILIKSTKFWLQVRAGIETNGLAH
jgi:hypothetical protein